MDIKDQAKNLYSDLKTLIESLLAEGSNEVRRLQQAWGKITAEKKKELLMKKQQLLEKYQEYVALVKAKANDAKDELADKVAKLQQKIEELDID
jgi:uncharacterized protein YukE